MKNWLRDLAQQQKPIFKIALFVFCIRAAIFYVLVYMNSFAALMLSLLFFPENWIVPLVGEWLIMPVLGTEQFFQNYFIAIYAISTYFLTFLLRAGYNCCEKTNKGRWKHPLY